jgi:hypothetical protein
MKKVWFCKQSLIISWHNTILGYLIVCQNFVAVFLIARKTKIVCALDGSRMGETPLVRPPPAP